MHPRVVVDHEHDLELPDIHGLEYEAGLRVRFVCLGACTFVVAGFADKLGIAPHENV